MMLAQILNREFVLDQLELVYEELKKPPDERRGAEEEDLPAHNSPEDFIEAAAAVSNAKAREASTSSGQKGYDNIESRRGQEPALIDDFVFISGDPIVSLLQTALQRYFDTVRPDLVEEEPAIDDERRGPEGVAIVTGSSLIDCPPFVREADGRRVFNAYSETDPRWLASWIAEGLRLFRGRHAFNQNAADNLAIADNARLILVGDWGSGVPRAVALANQMRNIIDEDFGDNVGTQHKVHVIHLGDVYYSGWKTEYENNFLQHWPVRVDEASEIGSWCLNGNHDMYSGGHAYFDFLLKDPRFEKQQRSSFFSLTTKFWDILGLDTAYEDADLVDPQTKWLEDILLESPRKSMLLSHHQLFSAYDHDSPKLRKRLDNLLSKRKIDAWFWGHEHRCVFYNECDNVRQARLIGNGGVPVYMTHFDNEYEPPACFEYRQTLNESYEPWALFGFAVVDLLGPKARVRYIDEDGYQFADDVIS